MNEFQKEIDELCQREYALYEGLITSYPIEHIKQILIRYGYDFYPKEEKNINYFFIKYVFDQDKNIANKELNDLLTLINNFGWFPVNMGYGDNLAKILKWNKSKTNFYNLLKTNYNTIKFLFEPKYDTPAIIHEKFLYHLTPSVYVNKILKYGLIPKSRSKKAYHPDRIYLAKTPEFAKTLIEDFKTITEINDWTILQVDTQLDIYLKLYKDQNFETRGYYTLNTISPISIEIYNKDIIDKNYFIRIDCPDHMRARGVKKKPGDKTPNYEY